MPTLLWSKGVVLKFAACPRCRGASMVVLLWYLGVLRDCETLYSTEQQFEKHQNTGALCRLINSFFIASARTSIIPRIPPSWTPTTRTAVQGPDLRLCEVTTTQPTQVYIFFEGGGGRTKNYFVRSVCLIVLVHELYVVPFTRWPHLAHKSGVICDLHHLP